MYYTVDKMDERIKLNIRGVNNLFAKIDFLKNVKNQKTSVQLFLPEGPHVND